MKLERIILSILLFFPLSCPIAESKSIPFMDKLEHTLRMRNSYETYFKGCIEELQEMKAGDTLLQNHIVIDFKLAVEYSSYSLDSALFYLDKVRVAADALGKTEYMVRADMFKVFAYTKSGMYYEAQKIIRLYNPELLEGNSAYAYDIAAHKLSLALETNDMELEDFLERPEFYRARLLEQTPPNTYLWYDLMREEQRFLGDRKEERRYAELMLSCCSEGTSRYADAAYKLSVSYQDEDEDMRLFWLMRSAISDVVSATKDYQALNSIAQILFERGDIERAFEYTADYCLPDALFYNGKRRPLQIAQFFSEIEMEYEYKQDRVDAMKTFYLFLLGGLVILSLILILIIFSRNKSLVYTQNKLQETNDLVRSRNDELEGVNAQLNALNMKLRDADKVKQEYISLFLSILSDNIDTSRKYKNHVLLNIRKGNTALLEEEIENLPPIDEDIEEFYKMFDQTFVNMYPDFVEKFNSLLMEGEEVYSKNPEELLSPEQRIFALVMLGITDSSKIASLLHYSTNTIYNYKVKIRNKVKGDRSLFEDNLRNAF